MNRARELSQLCESQTFDLEGFDFEPEYDVDSDPDTGDAKITITELTLDYGTITSPETGDPAWKEDLDSLKEGDKVSFGKHGRITLDRKNVVDVKGTYPIKKVSISGGEMKIGVEIEVFQKWES